MSCSVAAGLRVLFASLATRNEELRSYGQRHQQLSLTVREKRCRSDTSPAIEQVNKTTDVLVLTRSIAEEATLRAPERAEKTTRASVYDITKLNCPTFGKRYYKYLATNLGTLIFQSSIFSAHTALVGNLGLLMLFFCQPEPKIVYLQNCYCAFNRFRRLRIAQPMFLYSDEQLLEASNQQNRLQ